MNNRKLKKTLYIISITELSSTFIIKIVIDSIQKSLSKGIADSLLLKIIFASILISTFIFITIVYYQYKIENSPSSLSCIYNSTTKCCLFNSIPLQNHIKINSETITDVELAKYERTVNTKEIWLLSLDLSVEESNNVFKEVVRSRLYEGVKYSFIALNSPISKERAKKIKSQYKSIFTNKNMHFYLLDNNSYDFFLSLYALAIYNPTSNFEKTQAYICVGETNSCETSIYAKLNESHTQYATNIIRDIIRETNEYFP